MTDTDIQRQIRKLRISRAAYIAAALLLVVVAITATLPLAATFMMGVPVAILLARIEAQTSTIRQWRVGERELARPRMTLEDYRRLREMEAELGWELTEFPAGRTSPAKGGGGGGEYTTVARRVALSPAETVDPVREIAVRPVGSGCRQCGQGYKAHREGGDHARARRVAMLPEKSRERTVATMEPGRTYWTVPWAMLAGEDGRLWLRPGYTAWNRPGGTISMRIELREDGCHVWPVPGEAYTPEAPGSQPLMPVAVLEGE